MTAKEAIQLANEARESLSYEHRCFIETVRFYAKQGLMHMPAPTNMSNELRSKLLSEGYTITPQTVYWQTEEKPEDNPRPIPITQELMS